MSREGTGDRHRDCRTVAHRGRRRGALLDDRSEVGDCGVDEPQKIAKTGPELLRVHVCEQDQVAQGQIQVLATNRLGGKPCPSAAASPSHSTKMAHPGAKSVRMTRSPRQYGRRLPSLRK